MKGGYSYLACVQEQIDPNIYQRGLRYYLEGRVGQYVQLKLPFWREYDVHGREQHSVRLPLVHLLLGEHITERNEAFCQFATCTCDYFAAQNTCKHIVAVAAALDKEFVTSALPAKQLSVDITSSLNTLFSIEQSKKQQQWYQDFEYYLSLSEEGDPQHLVLRNLQYTVLDAFANPERNAGFLADLAKLVDESFESWSRQRKMSLLLASERFWMIGLGAWWTFWKPFLYKFEHQLHAQVLANLFCISEKNAHLFADFYEEFTKVLRGLTIDQKNAILIHLAEQQSPISQQIRAALVMHSELFLREHLDEMSLDLLFRAVKIIPDEQEKIEYALSSQLKTWSDFLDASSYNDLVNAVQQWRQVIGETSELDKVLLYIQTNHKSKRSLMARLR